MTNSTNLSSTPAASRFQPRASSTPIMARELRKGLSRWLSMSTLQMLKSYYPLYTSLAVPARSKSVFLLPSHPIPELLGLWPCPAAVPSHPPHLPSLLAPPQQVGTPLPQSLLPGRG